MKKILFLLLLLPVFAWAQPCADEDTVRNNATSLLTATSVRINGTISHFSGSYVTLYLKYVRSGMTDTVTVSGVNPLRNLSGLQPSTLYRYYYMTSCASGSEYQLGTYTFTTLSSSVAYVYERPTYFNYIRADTGLTVPRVDTALYRSPNTAGGDIVFKTSDSKFYGYNGSYWQWLGVDSAGILPTLNLKVDSVTVSGDSLFYWVNGTGYGYILPANSNDWQLDGNTGADNFLGTTDNTSLRFRTNNTAVAVLDSNGRFGIGTNSPLYPIDVYKSINSDAILRIKNDNAGVGATSHVFLDNGTSVGSMFHTGTGVTPVDYILANQTSYSGSGVGGVALGAAAGAPIKFFQVQTEIARFSSTGIFGVGTTTPDSLITSHLGLHAKRGVRFSGLPTGVGTKAVRIDANGTLSIADTTTSGGSGTVNSGTQYRIAYYATAGTAVSEAPAITASRALISDANGVPTHSTTTTTQLQYLNGATGTTGTTTTNLVFSTSPTLVTPVLGVATATSINGATITSGTLNGSVTGTNTGDQTITNSSDATSHTVTLSASGGTVQLIEGSNITLTTGGTGSAGTVTIASTGGGLTVGSTAIASGTGTRLLYETSGNVLGEITGATSDGTKVTLTKPSINNIEGTYTTTATAAGTTTLTVSSTYEQYFTGVTTQTCVMPDATTLTVGMGYRIVNNSTGVVTVNKNGGTLIKAMAAGTELFVQVTDISSAAGTYSTGYSTDLAVGTGTATNITFAAGTTSVSPINMASGTLKTTPADGDIEMNGDAMYGTTDAGNRGMIPVEHFIRANATRTFTSNTSQQAIFTDPANGTLTLETGTYFFEGLIAMTSMSATSGNGKFSLIGAGTATLGAVLWQAYGNDLVGSAETTGAATGGSWHIIATQTATNVITAATGAEMCFLVKGTFEVTGAGTIIPSFAQTTAAAAVVSIGSYFKCNRVGSTSAVSVGQWN